MRTAALPALAELSADVADPRVTALRYTVGLRERAIDPNAYAPAELWRA